MRILSVRRFALEKRKPGVAMCTLGSIYIQELWVDVGGRDRPSGPLYDTSRAKSSRLFDKSHLTPVLYVLGMGIRLIIAIIKEWKSAYML